MTTTRNLPPLFQPPSAVSVEGLRRLAASELSLPSRRWHVALLLAALIMTSVIASLWLTEPVLPLRTQLAFGVMTAIGLSWMVFAGWVLARRRVLFAQDRVMAGRMAVTFTAVFTVGALAVGYTTGGRAPYAAAALGVVMLVAAVVVLMRAHRTFDRLNARRQTLQREIGVRKA